MKVSEDLAEMYHSWYIECRKLTTSKKIPFAAIQAAFEHVTMSNHGRDCWRPTHITENAVRSFVYNLYRKDKRFSVQRAHGSVEGRLGRRERTLEILSGPERTFDQWWQFLFDHDKTVLMTKHEHHLERKIYKEQDLYELPDWTEGMFDNAGKNVRIRVAKELKWLKELAIKQNIQE